MRRLVPAVAAVVLAATACTAADDTTSSGSSPPSSPAGSSAGGTAGSPESSPSATGAAPSAAPPSTAPTPTDTTPTDTTPTDTTPTAEHQVSLPTLMSRSYDGGRLRRTDVLLRTDDYVRHSVRYRSDGLTVSGILNVPNGRGPFPVVVMAHGYIDPAIYVNGQGLMREQDWLAQRGFAVLHTDFRGHAFSDETTALDREMRLGYTIDTINAVMAVKRAAMPRLDEDRVSLLGRSMGGGVVYNALVAQPGLVDAAVVFAPVSSNAVDNFERWTRPERPDAVARIERRFGLPQQDPTFWRQVSARTYVDRITEPVMIHHGTSDDSCPYRWSVRTTRAMEDAGVSVRLRTYEGEEHAFGPQWPQSMRRTLRFLKAHTDNPQP